ncbi:MAG: hypothetical protein HKO65_15170 [Gemmatimonadetes bacterium]|nr:hypothetical protein [Gemmatimonadota bacterium]NNM06432.1 hypothetical protein [Gemmatimonadota bacterium]
MNRRDFFRVAVGGIAAATFNTSSAGCEGPEYQNPDFMRWTWVHGGGGRTPSQWKDQYRLLSESGFHGVLVGGGETAVHAEAAQAAGIEFHRWVWTLNRNGDAWVKQNHPEWFTVSRDQNSSLTHSPYVEYYKWLCPTRPAVREYLKDTLLGVAEQPGIQGVHLDYVRHSDVILPRGLWAKYDLVQDREYPEFDFCYCNVCREAFASIHGIDPLDLPDPPSDQRWRRFRWDSVTGLVETLAEAVHGVPVPGRDTVSALRSGPGMPLTAAVFPTPMIAKRLVRQAWDEWPLDAFFPMLYHSFYEEDLEWIGRGVREGLAALSASRRTPGADPLLPKNSRLFAGLYLPALSSEEVQKAEEIARKAGADGVSFFEMASIKS